MNKTQKNLVLALAIGMFLLALAPNVNAACTSVSACGNITVSGCYTFTANVTYSTAGGVCSHILANDVRIDGNGFWLSSNAIATQGIIIENTTSSTRTNVTITNLVINNFTNAIVSTNKVSNLFVDNNRFYRNVRSIKLDNTNSSFITRNYISNVLGSTPKAQNDGNGIQVEINSRQTNVTNNQIYNVSNGINIGTGSGGTSAPSIIQGNIGSAFYQTDLGLGVGLGCDGCQYNSFNNNSMNISGYFTAGESRIANPNYQPKNNNWTNNNFFGIFNLNTTESPGVFILNNSNNTILFQNTIVASTFTAMTVINSSNLNFTSNRFGRTVYFGNSTGTILSSIIIDRNVFTKGEFPIPIGNDGITLQTSNNTIFRNNVLNYTEQLDYFAQPVLFLSQLNNSAIYNNTITRLSINNINSTANNSILNNTISISGALTPITITGLIPNHNSTLNSTVFANGTQTITLGTGIAGTANASAVLVNNSRRDTIYNNATASNSSIYQYWTRNWYVNQSGSPAAGANLTIRNDQNRQVFSCITDSNGWCNQTLHLQLFQNATLTDNHTVWNITATKSGQSNTTNVTVDFYGNFQMNLPATLTSACATITQNTTLGANIVGNAGGGACIRFGADNIELFCADKRIDGHATAAVDDFGVDTNGFDNIWIRNCTIQGFTHNIKITNSTGVTILDSHLSSPNAASSPTLSPYNVFFNSSNTANNVTIVNTFVTNATSTDVLVQNSIDNVTILNSTFSGGKTNLNGLYFTGNRLRVHNSTFFNYSEAIYYTDAVGTVRNQSIEFSNFTNNIYDNAQYCAFTYITSGVGICIQTSTNLDTLNISYSSFTNSHAALGFYQTSATHGGYIYGSNFSGNNYIVETDGAVILNFTNSSFQNYTGIVLDGRGFTSYGNGFLNVSGVDTSKIDCDAGECNYSIEWWKAVNVSYSDDLTPVGSASGRANSSRGKLFGPLYTTNASGIVQNIRVLQESGTRPSNVKVVETPWSFNASFGNINQTLDSTNQSNMILLLLNPR
ncbi:hypothetical protein HUU53_04045, partial [Candidatus Micrarchaeota archaeon]|nr:hypothetical protein [Candidatus Micrarchaeota archaeon]